MAANLKIGVNQSAWSRGLSKADKRFRSFSRRIIGQVKVMAIGFLGLGSGLAAAFKLLNLQRNARDWNIATSSLMGYSVAARLLGVDMSILTKSMDIVFGVNSQHRMDRFVSLAGKAANAFERLAKAAVFTGKVLTGSSPLAKALARGGALAFESLTAGPPPAGLQKLASEMKHQMARADLARMAAGASGGSGPNQLQRVGGFSRRTSNPLLGVTRDQFSEIKKISAKMSMAGFAAGMGVTGR